MSYYSFFPIGNRGKETFYSTKYTILLLTVQIFAHKFKGMMTWDKENWFLHKEFIVIWSFFGLKLQIIYVFCYLSHQQIFNSNLPPPANCKELL